MAQVQENIIYLGLSIGQKTLSVKQSLDEGKVIGVIAYHNNFTNNEFCRLAITDANGNDLAKLQNIENYRSREVEYSKDGKTLRFDGGRPVTVTAIFKDNLIVASDIEVIFIYENTNQ